MKKRMISGIVLSVAMAAQAEVNPYAGLWVGSVSLVTVNEVSIPFDADNIARAPDPVRPTLTGDRADIRLILHVNAAGQVSLLKDVAIVNRNPSGAPSSTIADIATAGSDEFSVALVTDPSLYAEYPMQKATRFSSVVFDFGDAQATRVLNTLVSNAVNFSVATVAARPASAISTAAQRNQIVEDVVAAVKAWPPPADNVAAEYQDFLASVKSAVPAIAQSPSPTAGAAGTWMNDATIRANKSSFKDTRGMELVRAVQAAGPGLGNDYRDAWNAAANWADVNNTVTRLLSSKVMGDTLVAAAKYAAAHPGTTVAQLALLPSSTNAVRIVLITPPSKWNEDTRAKDALDAMFAAVVAAAATGHGSGAVAAEIQQLAYTAGVAALNTALAKYPAPRNAPGTDYTAFVTSADYAAVAEKAARAATAAALTERVQNPLTYELTMKGVALAAAVNALQSTYAAAARARQNELPLDGTFALDKGDPRFMLDVPVTDALGAAGLTGQIILPANYPTNPFRHRRNPDHAVGYDITRNIRIDFDAAEKAGVIPSVARGVSQVTGLYREEFFGLHKLLGPQQDVGLRTEGRFQLNRVSTISTLNGK